MRETPDPLDNLLERTAPAGVESNAELARELATMSHKARRVSAAPRRKPARVALGAGLALILLGGAGAAAAGTVFNWAPWAQDPDIAYPFSLPSGRACEARVQVLEVVSIDEDGIWTSAYDPELGDHFRSLDAMGAADIEGAIEEVRARDSTHTTVGVRPDGTMSDLPTPPGGPSEDDVYAAAVNVALGDVLESEMAAYGLTIGQWNTNMDILCEPVDQ